MQLPGYRIIRKINQGGMSSVYLAVQLSVGREVALKVMSPVLNADPVFSRRFQREANIVGQLPHPNIISIYDIGCYKGLNYIAMDYLPGGTVHERMVGGMSRTDILQVIKEVARALDVAHTKGYVHRDIKPENILFREDGTAVLTDFGVAKTLSAASQATNAGTVVGTPHYMSPEQSRGLPIDGRSDIYSLGIVFYEMLTGVVPYQADEAVAIAIKHLTAPIPSLPPQYSIFQHILDRLLAKNPGDRFQSGAEIVEALVAVEETLTGHSGRRTPLTDPSAMNTTVLLKALWLTSIAALRVKLARLGHFLFAWKWSPGHGLVRRERDASAIRTEVDTGESQRITVVSDKLRQSPGQPRRGRFAGWMTRGLAMLVVVPLLWVAASMAFAKLKFPPSNYLPEDLGRAFSATASAIDNYKGLFFAPDSAKPATGVDAQQTESGKTGTPVAATREKPAPETGPTADPLFTLTVRPEPSDARVRILNIREPYRDGIELEPGPYHLEVSGPGYRRTTQWIRLRDSDRTIDITLEPLHSPGELFSDSLTRGGTGPEMVVIAPGRFTRGKQGESRASPPGDVRIATKFAVSRYEVTFAHYGEFVEATGATMPDDNNWGKGSRPVINVSWHDAVDFTRWLSEQTGARYRLPTEAEWEYLARAGSKADNWWGKGEASGRANCRRGCDSDYTGLFSSKTAPVGSFSPNPFKVYDTAGNVAEWVQDCYQDHYIGAPDDGSAFTTENCSSRTVRGGAANDDYPALFSYARKGADASTRSDMIGFRVVREFRYVGD